MIDDPGQTTIGAIAGAVGLKVVEKIFGLRKRKLDEASQIRAELRTEVLALKAQITAVYGEVDTWRERYYKQVEVNAELKAEIVQLRAEIAVIRGTARSERASNLDS